MDLMCFYNIQSLVNKLITFDHMMIFLQIIATIFAKIMRLTKLLRKRLSYCSKLILPLILRNGETEQWRSYFALLCSLVPFLRCSH